MSIKKRPTCYKPQSFQPLYIYCNTQAENKRTEFTQFVLHANTARISDFHRQNPKAAFSAVLKYALLYTRLQVRSC